MKKIKGGITTPSQTLVIVIISLFGKLNPHDIL